MIVEANNIQAKSIKDLKDQLIQKHLDDNLDSFEFIENIYFYNEKTGKDKIIDDPKLIEKFNFDCDTELQALIKEGRENSDHIEMERIFLNEKIF